MNLHRPRLACFSLFLNLELFCRNLKKKQLLNSALAPRPHPPRSEEFFISCSASFNTVEPRYNKPPYNERRYNEPLYNEVLGLTNDFPYPSTVEPRYNEPLYNEVLGITNDFPYPSK